MTIGAEKIVVLFTFTPNLERNMKRSELSHPIPEPKPRPETAVGVLVEQFETGLITLDEFTSGVCSITMRRQLELEEGKMLALQFHEVVLRMRALMGMG